MGLIYLSIKLVNYPCGEFNRFKILIITIVTFVNRRKDKTDRQTRKKT